MGETLSLTGEFIGETQCPTMYTNPPAWESAPENTICLWVVGEVTSSQHRAEQVELFPHGPLLHIQCQSAATWFAPPWQIPNTPPLTM